MSEFVVREENPKRINFTILQNILSKIGLTAFERSLYWAIKECAGKESSCTKSQPNLSEMSGMSVPSVQRTLKKLEEVNKFLGKPLIRIVHRISTGKEKDTNEIIITDIWDENADIQKNISPITQIVGPITEIGGVLSHRCIGPITQMDKQDVLKISNIQQQDVAVFFECLKNENRLTDKEKQSIMDTGASEDRVKLAIEYSNTAKIKKTRVATIIWHCTFEEVIKPAIKKKPLSQQLKDKFKHGKEYNNATCYYQDGYIAFERGMTNKKAFLNSEQDVKKILDHFGIKFDYEWTKN